MEAAAGREVQRAGDHAGDHVKPFDVLIDLGDGGQQRLCVGMDRMRESVQVGRQVLWFSVLVSKASNLPAIQTALKKAGVRESQVVDMSQGNKQSRFVAWTFHDKEQQLLWREKNWK